MRALLCGLALLLTANGPPPGLAELEARQTRLRRELGDCNESMSELLGLKLVLLRVLKDKKDLMEETAAAEHPIVSSAIDGGGVDLDVEPIFYMRCPARVRIQPKGGERAEISLTWQDATELGDAHALSLSLGAATGSVAVNGQEFGGLAGATFRVVVPTRFQLVVQRLPGSRWRVVVVNGHTRQVVDLRGDRLESREFVSGNRVVPEVPAPSAARPGWLFREPWFFRELRLSLVRGGAREFDAASVPVVVPLLDGSTLVRPPGAARPEDDPSLTEPERDLLRSMVPWMDDVFCARDEHQAALLQALCALDEDSQRVEEVDPRGDPEAQLPVLARRTESVKRVAEVGAALDRRASEALEKASKLRAELTVVRREIVRLAQSLWLEDDGELGALIDELGRTSPGGR
jgi:hypothetical protein